MRASVKRHLLILRDPFALATGVSHQRVSFALKLEDEQGRQGRGEATPLHYRGETPEALARTLDEVSGFVVREAARFEEILEVAEGDAPSAGSGLLAGADRMLVKAFPEERAARAAALSALYDLLGHRAGKPLHALLGLPNHPLPPCSFTLAETEPVRLEELARAALARGFKTLKVKVGQPGADDIELVATVRRVHEGALLVDANGGWTPAQAERRISELAALKPGLVEQPIPAGNPEALRRLREASPLPIFADEDSLDLRDLTRLPGCVDGVNVKLMKCGGLDEALRMIPFARAQGWKVMLGCMVESSLGITAAVHLASLADYADLDGACLLRQDPYLGAEVIEGEFRMPAGPGLGVTETP